MRKLILTISLMIAGFAHAQTTVTLTAPNILGVSCGGYQSGSKVTLVGFDANGNLQATVYEIMSCSSGGRGSTPRRYTGTSVVTWDFRGGVITSYDAPLATPAAGTSAVDNYGNVATLGNPNVLQVALTINQMPPNPNYVEALVPNLIGDTDAVAQAAIAAAGLVDGGAYINYTYAAPGQTCAIRHRSRTVGDARCFQRWRWFGRLKCDSVSCGYGDPSPCSYRTWARPVYARRFQHSAAVTAPKIPCTKIAADLIATDRARHVCTRP